MECGERRDSMSSSSSPPETKDKRISIMCQKRLEKLETIERELISCLTSAGNTLTELSKDKPNGKQVESHAVSFMNSLQKVESDLSQELNYLSQVSSGQSHEGSVYASEKMLSMAHHRLEHAKSRLNHLDKINRDYANIHQKIYDLAQFQVQQMQHQNKSHLLHPD